MKPEAHALLGEAFSGTIGIPIWFVAVVVSPLIVWLIAARS